MVLYTCATSRGVVLDVATDQGAEQLWKVFVDLFREGVVQMRLSDHGSNFTAEET